MRAIGLGFLSLLLAACASAPGSPPADLVLKAVNVVDVETATVAFDQEVVIRAGRIASVRPASTAGQAAARQIVDGHGLYLIPALWDLHVHLEAFTAPEEKELDPQSWGAPLAMSYGVLGMRDMGSRTDEILALRDAFNERRDSGEPAPLLRVAGQSFSGEQPWGRVDHTLIPATPIEAAELVRAQAARGVDFIKVHDFLAPAIYRAIVTTARAQDMRVVGHLRAFAGPVDAAKLGQKDFDHLPPELLAFCGPDGARDTEAFYEGWYTGGPGYYEREMAKLYDPNGCAAMFRGLAELNVSVTPTLSVRAPVRDRTFAAAGRLLPATRLIKCTDTKRFLDSAAGPDIEAYRAMISAVVRDLDDAGIEILAGTDGAPESCGVPGLILLDEMEQLVEAGLTGAQVLRAATSGGARKAGLADAGAITTGARADLVMLYANPLETFATLEEPAGIVSAGRYLNRDAVLALREGAARYAKSLDAGAGGRAEAPG